MLTAILLLALNVYHEARGEPELGQIAVVHVVFNRAKRNNRSIREVILRPSQFSWTLEPKYKWVPQDLEAYEGCLRVALEAVSRDDPTHGATHYHTTSISPYWASSMVHTVTIGNHVFYKE